MPVHDWTRVVSGNFHDFHVTWIGSLRNALNSGLLPGDYYALAEQRSGGVIPDVLTLESRGEDEWNPGGSTENGGTLLAVAEHPPQVEFIEQMDRDIYAERANRIAIYHANGDRVVAYVEIVSEGNKHTGAAMQCFFDKLDEALDHGCHLLVIDLHPPGKRDPHGLHAVFWERRHDSAHRVTAERPFGLSAYHVSVEAEVVIPRAYFQPVALGQELPDMPLFLTPDHYINVPLERTYREAWQGVPKRWRNVIDPPAAAAG